MKPLLKPTVDMHPSGMVARHNYPCPVCRNKVAVLELHTGRFSPCWSCQSEGWRVTKLSLITRWLLGL